MKRLFSAVGIATLTLLLGGCGMVNDSPVGKAVGKGERYGDRLGAKRDVRVLGRDVVIEPEADKKIRIDF